MFDFIVSSSFFGITLSFVVYMFFQLIKVKFKINNPLFNPLLWSSVVIILFLMVTKIDYEVYNSSAGVVTYWLTPVTICLAIPLYRRVQELKENIVAIVISIICGCIGHALVMVVIATAVKMSKILSYSVMSKSVTTAIAMALTEKLGGIPAVTIVGVTVAGMTGAVLGPTILKIFKIKEPVAQGLAMGTASHAVGTSKAMELGEIQGAMSSLAIVVTGILTVVVVPIAVKFL
ncbi:TIGR00659 family protein [Lachnospiraceae bacterium YSD2013]|jgi:predicted murein hydrolase (TIGR00659 family)|nr:TIGR00659 family protein [Lachnospiraceae bacterium YSD2013]